MKKLLAMLVATFALGLTVGCGGSSSTPAVTPKPGTTTATTKPEEPKKEEPKKEEPKKEEPKKEEPKKEEPKKEEPKK